MSTLDDEGWESRMAARARARRVEQPEPVDPHCGPGHVYYYLGNATFCSCSEQILGCFTIGLDGTVEESCYFAAQSAFFGYLREHGFEALNGALGAAVKAVLARYRSWPALD